MTSNPHQFPILTRPLKRSPLPSAVWGIEPVFKREGGSIPVVAYMQRYLNIGQYCWFGLSDDNIHSPNEKLHLPTWYKGIA